MMAACPYLILRRCNLMAVCPSLIPRRVLFDLVWSELLTRNGRFQVHHCPPWLAVLNVLVSGLLSIAEDMREAGAAANETASFRCVGGFCSHRLIIVAISIPLA